VEDGTGRDYEDGYNGHVNRSWKMRDEGGPFLAVWTKEAEGNWRLVIDLAWYWEKPKRSPDQ
jgi:hypothetical protein